MHQLYRHTHTISTPFSPRPASGFHTFPRPHSHTNQSTNDTVPQTHATDTHTTTNYRYHNHTAPQTPTTIRRHPHDAGPPTLSTHREAMPYPDVVAAPTLQSQPPSGSVHSQSDRHQADHFVPQDWPNQVIRPDQATHQTKTRSGQVIDTSFAETSRQVSANFSAKPDHGSIRDACEPCRRVDVDTVDAGALALIAETCRGRSPQILTR